MFATGGCELGECTRRMNTLTPLVSAPATKEQVNESQQWHKLRIESRGSKVTVYWDGKKVLSYDNLEKAEQNFVTFWVNYTEATYRNIKLTATDEWGAKRAANGHPEPYNVKYWEIDNEMWEMARLEQCLHQL